MRERSFQLFELFRGAMQFYAVEIGQGEHLRQRRADVLQMSENALGAFVAFTAANFVAVNTEAVEKILCLARSFFDKSRKDRFHRFKFSRMHFEVRMEADEV
jgi:hypothetical protein